MFLLDDIQFTPHIEDAAPNAITDLSVEVNLDTDVQAVLNWKNPTIDNSGNPLSTMTGVKIYRGTHPMNLVEIADLSGTAGELMTYTDNLPEEASYIHRLVPYNDAGNGKMYDTPLTYFGYETVPGAPKNIAISKNGSLQNVLSWDEVDYGELGGPLADPVVGYTIIRNLGTDSEVLAEMHSGTTFTEVDTPDLNLYRYSVIAQTSTENLGVPGTLSAYSGLGENQVSVTTGMEESDQAFELSRNTIISQSIYTPEEIGATGLITSLSYFGNLGYAYPLALGAKVAQPGRTVVAISGDGGFLYNSQELATAVKYGINAIVIVFNDNAYGNVLRDQVNRFEGRIIGSKLHNPDFVKLAEAYGAMGIKTAGPQELGSALERAILADVPVLIEVPVGPMPSPW